MVPRMPKTASPTRSEHDEAFTHATGRDGQFGWRLVALEFAPPLSAILVFAGGCALLASAAQPAIPARLQALLQAWPLAGVELSHFLASIIGMLLLMVAGGLWRRLDGAYYLTLVLLVLGAAFSMLKALDWEEACLLGFIALAMATTRAAYFRRSRLTEGLLTAPWMMGVAGVLGLVVWLMLIAYTHVDYRDELWWTVLKDADIARSLRALSGTIILALLASAWLALHPSRPAPNAAERHAAMTKAEAVFQQASGAHGEANLLFTGDKRFVYTASGKSFVMYRPRGGLWIAMGDPVGPRAERLEALTAFHAAADAASASPTIYAASADLLPALIELGYAVRKIGEAAMVDLEAFSLEGPARARLRQAKNRLLRDGWRFQVREPGGEADWEGLRRVSSAWLARHVGREKQFSLGRFDRAYLDRFPIGIAKREGSPPAAFVSLWPTPDKGDIAVDLMRMSPDAPNGMMDFLLVGVIEWAKQAGYARLDIGMTPLAGLSFARYAPALSKIGATIYDIGEEVYGFRGLRAYKAKFGPTWRPVFIAAPGHVSLPMALASAALLTSGGWLGLLRS